MVPGVAKIFGQAFLPLSSCGSLPLSACKLAGLFTSSLKSPIAIIWPIPSALSESTRNCSLSMAVWRFLREPLPSLEG